MHPQTGETVPAAFRLSAFMPVNIPICVGMLLAAPTVRYLYACVALATTIYLTCCV